ncbi:MAG: RNA-binding S4 domain-containing protein [Limimaricola sp.]|uniref:RNA-binding S4 domain-containing protein n=1 Tax=Limimaricola sp. TaxID=2211665 RepID=UPI001E03DADB|nr:RNA-binding S4 domain-containing protein [Limimaricola sp.]MBI1416153.1 RNA-binding S4 domain-containing protein [Limimaricola sp.]
MSEATIRVDKWLWQARFFRTRTLATALVSAGKLRIDGVPISKPARMVGPGAVLTFPQGNAVRVVRIIACGDRRGPAPEAQALYDDLAPPSAAAPDPADAPAPGFDGGGRPGKRERRNMAQHRRDADPFALE